MNVRIVSPGNFDRHEAQVRFVATVDKRPVHITITTYAIIIIGEALGMASGDRLVTYAASGRLLVAVVAEVIRAAVAPRDIYLVTKDDVLTVTGRSREGNDHAPKKMDWLIDSF
ncbi:hypothetical protein [Allopontixanthobacter sediminis]|uniref:Uncharacterized protein n=1 Tax=Allopontixanthobacter sediminis TaxID=1689985 RepID=A0A845B3U1_9SPHN|nr:hypothetical protein [Allopontixanthobacter sediminis]MXP44856.1 hypothetical protein [Allopontixanthobacter sediminis]